MPPVIIGAVIGGLTTFVTGATILGVTFAAGSLAAFAVGFGVSLVLGLVAMALAPEPPDLGGFAQDAEGRTRQLRQSIVERRLGYGEIRVSGPMVYAGTTNDDNDFHIVIVLAGHEVSSIDEIWLDDYVIYNDMIDQDGEIIEVEDARYWRDEEEAKDQNTDPGSLVRIKKHLGSPNQAADADLVSEVSEWTNSHKLSGLPYIYVTLRFDPDAFPSAIPNISAVVKTKPLKDPRDGSVQFSTNSALALYDYMQEDLGIRADSTEIETSFVTAAANICDEFVTVTTETFTASSASTDNHTLTVSAAGDFISLQLGDRVDLTTSGTLPAPLAASTNYYYVPYRRGNSTDGGPILIQLAESFDKAHRATEKAILLNGTEGYISCGTATETAFDATTDAFSVEAYVSSTNVPTGTEILVSRIDIGETNDPGWKLWTDANDYLQFTINDSAGGVLNVRSTTATITDGEWHHVAVTYDGSTNASGVNLYIDGVGVAKTTVTDTLTGTALPASANLMFGAEDNNDAPANFFDGKITDVRIWNTERTSTEILDNYDLAIDPASTGLVGLWKFNENTGYTLADAITASGNDGTLSTSDTAVTGYATWTQSRHVIHLTSAGTGPHNVRKIAEPRYTATGLIESDKRPVVILEQILSSMGGRLVFAGGSWRMLAAAYSAPTVTLNESHIISGGSIGIKTKASRRERFNAVKGIFISPMNQWQPSDYPPVTNATYESEDNGIQIFHEHNLPFTNRPHTAQRLAKVRLERHRQMITLNYPCNLSGFQVQAGDFVQISNDRFGWGEKVFEVLGWKMTAREQDDTVLFGVDLELQESASGVFDWNNGEETEVDLAPNTNLPNIWTASQPLGVTVASEVEDTAAGDQITKLKMYWSPPNDAFVSHDGLMELAFRRATGNALNFVSGDSDYVDIGDITEISYTASTPFSVEFNMNQTTASTSEQVVVSRQDSGETGDPGWAVSLDTSGFARFNLIDTASSNELIVRNKTNLADGSWHHVAMTYDGSKSSTGVKMYIDSTGVATTAVADTLTGTATPTDSRLLIGARDINSTGQDRYLDASLDDLRIWADVRTSTEIAENSTSELTGTESNLDGYWRFNEITGSTDTKDRSPNGNTGLLKGPPTYTAGNLTPEWEPSFYVSGRQTETFIGPVSNGLTYDVRIRSVSHLGVRSPWVTVNSVVAGGDTIGISAAKDYGLITESINLSLDYYSISTASTAQEDYSGI